MTDLAADILAIQNLKAAYCQCVDLFPHDAATARDRAKTVLAADAVGDYGFRTLNGCEEMVEFLGSAIAKSSEWAMHTIHSPLIEIGDGHATGEWTMLAHMKRRETGAVDVITGRYSDEFIQTPDGWRISKVKFEHVA